MTLKCPCLVLAIAVLTLSGCGTKEPTPLEQKQAANYVSEAEFAATVREFPRAEDLLAKATALCPGNPGYWLSLGTVRMRMGQRDGARTAYKHALRAFEAIAAKDKSDSDPALQQVYVLALLGRVDDARSLQTKLLSRFPNDRDVRVFVEQKRLDAMLADPKFKESAL